MLPYVIVAIVIVVILGMGVLGILLIRRARAAADAIDEDSHEGASVESWTPPPVVSSPALLPIPGPAPASVPAPEPEYLAGVEQLLSEWRAKHELAVARASEQPPDEVPVEPEAGPSPAEQPGEVAPLMASDAVGHGAWGDSAATHAMTLADPLGLVVMDMLDGTGRLTPDDLKRLDVFRPERIDLAVQTVQVPPHLQGDPDASLRQAQIQLYAATLQLRAKWAAHSNLLSPGDTPYTARDFKLKMARDIMELPAADRAEVIGYLLGGLLNSPGSTPELKRAVIDVLEHLRSVALTNVLLDCLDDPDPMVQEYALAAADRLLED